MYPAFLSDETIIQQQLAEYPPIISSSTQSRFLSLIDKFYNMFLKSANDIWESLSNHLINSAHEESMRGNANEELAVLITEEREKLDEIRPK